MFFRKFPLLKYDGGEKRAYYILDCKLYLFFVSILTINYVPNNHRRIMMKKLVLGIFIWFSPQFSFALHSNAQLEELEKSNPDRLQEIIHKILTWYKTDDIDQAFEYFEAPSLFVGSFRDIQKYHDRLFEALSIEDTGTIEKVNALYAKTQEDFKAASYQQYQESLIYYLTRIAITWFDDKVLRTEGARHFLKKYVKNFQSQSMYKRLKSPTVRVSNLSSS